MKTIRIWLYLQTLSACWIFGCADRPTTAGRPARPEVNDSVASESLGGAKAGVDQSATSDTEVVNTNPVELLESNWSELQSLIAAQTGKVVVVDIWSTSCEPCLKELPHLMELQKRYPDHVVAISFDVDFVGRPNRPPQYYRERVIGFLQSLPESKVLHRMSTIAADELFTEIDLASIPAVYVYDKMGKLAKRFEGVDEKGQELTYETHVTPLVDTLVK